MQNIIQSKAKKEEENKQKKVDNNFTDRWLQMNLQVRMLAVF